MITPLLTALPYIQGLFINFYQGILLLVLGFLGMVSSMSAETTPGVMLFCGHQNYQPSKC
jgi:hypothetical protein